MLSLVTVGFIARAKEWLLSEDIVFQANPALASHLPCPYSKLSFNAPYTEAFTRLNEGYVSLGDVPNKQALKDRRIKLKNEEAIIKKSGELRFSVPASCRALVPAIQLAAAFDAAHTPQDDFLEKTCTLVVRDDVNRQNLEVQEPHRDPPDPETGQTQNVYSFASNHPTQFDRHGSPSSFEFACFSMGSLHNRPEIKLLQPKVPLRRLFVGIFFDYRPSRRALMAQRDAACKYGIN